MSRRPILPSWWIPLARCCCRTDRKTFVLRGLITMQRGVSSDENLSGYWAGRFPASVEILSVSIKIHPILPLFPEHIPSYCLDTFAQIYPQKP